MIKPYSGPWTPKEANHLIRRATYMTSMPVIGGMSELVDHIINFEVKPQFVKNYRDEELGNLADTDVPHKKQWYISNINNPTLSNYRVGSIKGAIVYHCTEFPYAAPKLAMFWHSHFCTSWSKQPDVKHFREWGVQNLVYLFFTERDFLKLVINVTINPSMLVMLNGYLNSKEQPDENYARELLELFTVGLDHYEQSDIVESAKVFTGITIDDKKSIEKLSDHTIGTISFSTWFNNEEMMLGNPDISTPVLDVVNWIETIFASQPDNIARHICRKLYRWYVGSDITQVIEDTYIKDLADIFKVNWDVNAVLKAIFTSDHFYRMQGSIIKSPIDYVFGLVDDLDIQFSGDLEGQYREYDYLVKAAKKMGQELGEPPNIKGWKAYYAPGFYQDWITMDTMSERTRFVDELFRGDILGFDHISWVTSYISYPADPNVLVKEACDKLFAVPVPDEMIAEIKNTHILNGLGLDEYWTRAWNRYQQDPQGEAQSVVLQRIDAMLKFILTSPEYQLT